MVLILRNEELSEDDIKRLPHNTREWVYNALDITVTFEVRNALAPMLDNRTAATYEFSKSLQGPVMDITMRGLLVDQNNRAETLALYRKQMKQLESQLTEIVNDGIGWPTPPNKFDPKTGKETAWWRSVPGLKRLFYEVLELPPVKKRSKSTGKFGPVLDRDALEKLSAYYLAEPLCAHILALRDLDKKRTLLENELDPDGRMRTNINIAGTNTGRLASSVSDFGTGGNQQNVDRDLRYVFVADPGFVFVNLDGEQADARNVGAICWNLFLDKYGPEFAGAYLDACESGDLHTTVCAMAWSDLAWPDPADFVDDYKGLRKAMRYVADQIAYRQDSYRQLAKKLGHGTNFYGQPPTMAKHTKTSKSIIQEFQNRYFAAFPAIPLWHQHVREELIEYSTITSLMGRRRGFFGRPQEDSTLREAIAYDPQSSTADEIDQGMLKLWRGRKRWDMRTMIQVHDSVLLQVPVDAVNEFVPWALDTMRVDIELEGGRMFHVPIEAKVGFNWGDYDPPDPKRNKPEKNPDGLRKWSGWLEHPRQFEYASKKKFSLDQLLS